MIENLRNIVKFYITHLSGVDFLSFGWLLVFFLFLLFLGIFVAKKRPLFAVLLIFADIGLLIWGGFYIKNFLDKKIRTNEVSLTKIQNLNFTDALILEGHLKNTSNKDFSICKIEINVIKTSDNSLDKIKNSFKPLAKRTIILKELIKVNEQIKFNTTFDGFKFKGDFNITSDGDCY